MPMQLGRHALTHAITLSLLAAIATSCGAQSTHTSAGGGPVAPSAPGTVPPLTQTFSSPMMGYSVRYPEGWTVTAATEVWTPDAPNFWDDPVGDRIESQTTGFRGTSQQLATGQSPGEWLNAYLALAPRGCGEREEVLVDGETGTIDLNGCAGQGRLGGRVFDVVVVSGDRGYDFTMEGEVDHDLLVAVLATVSFAPDEAREASPSP
jgi:hypothetical protein